MLVRCTACSSARSGGRRWSTSGTTDLRGMLVAPIFRHVCSVLAGSGSDWNNTMVPRLGLIAQRVTGSVARLPMSVRVRRDRAKDPTREYAIPWN